MSAGVVSREEVGKDRLMKTTGQEYRTSKGIYMVGEHCMHAKQQNNAPSRIMRETNEWMPLYSATGQRRCVTKNKEKLGLTMRGNCYIRIHPGEEEEKTKYLIT